MLPFSSYLKNICRISFPRLLNIEFLILRSFHSLYIPSLTGFVFPHSLSITQNTSKSFRYDTQSRKELMSNLLLNSYTSCASPKHLLERNEILYLVSKFFKTCEKDEICGKRTNFYISHIFLYYLFRKRYFPSILFLPLNYLSLASIMAVLLQNSGLREYTQRSIPSYSHRDGEMKTEGAVNSFLV